MLCRCCNAIIDESPLLEFYNMPKGAQYMPSIENVEQDNGQILQVYQCPLCGIIQLSGKPVSYYREVIRATGLSVTMQKFRISQFSDWIARYKLQNKKIIEIGCGSGDFIAMMKKSGAGNNVHGIEYSPELVKNAQKSGHKVWQMYIDNYSVTIPDAPYDAFYIMNFLEHSPNPRNFLHGILNNLVDDAVGIVEVPNFDYILKEGLYAEFIQDHLLYFTKDSLCRLLEWCGFEVQSCKIIWHDYIICAEVKKRRVCNMNYFYEKKNNVQNSVSDFLSEMKKNNITIAVWGAGHQAFANLAILNMSTYIKFVLDSAPFKQGKFTPVSHIPIISPNEITTRNIGAVLVMAGSYSTEILAILRKKYPAIIRAVIDPDGVKLDC